ncbi:MAG: metal ABC transporter substrate-binding protein [Actinomycetota bacterium]|nr:metal ABC transporter substrate-binding protein [Actinomycetota bacterium]
MIQTMRLTPDVTSRRRTSVRRAGALVAAAALLVAGCGNDSSAGSDTSGDAIDVIASFYPLQFVVQQVGGELVQVSNLTPAGTEPHDLELTPKDTAALQDARLVVYLAGFAPAVDEAVDSVAGGQAFDISEAARLDLSAGAGDEQAGDHDGVDPHFWLDPTRLADVADAVAERLAELNPEHAADFTTNAIKLRSELERLDAEFTAGLESCTDTHLVTSHTSFGYLAQRYGFEQLGISGLTPEEEPSPAQLAEVADFVSANDVTTIYYETLVDPAIAETVADETGATTAVLDPLEGLSDRSAGSNYFEVMRSNLTSLRSGQRCA